MNKADWNKAAFVIKRDGAEVTIITAKGRMRWALECLIKAVHKGCTTILNPAPRRAAYVYKLRYAEVAVETITEQHAGAFAGTHARYVLRDLVERVV